MRTSCVFHHQSVLQMSDDFPWTSKGSQAPGRTALALGDIKGQGGGGNPCFPSGNSAQCGPSPGPRPRLFEMMAAATFADERGIGVHGPATWIEDVSSLFTRGTSVLLRPRKRPRAPWSTHVANPGEMGLTCMLHTNGLGVGTLHPSFLVLFAHHHEVLDAVPWLVRPTKNAEQPSGSRTDPG